MIFIGNCDDCISFIIEEYNDVEVEELFLYLKKFNSSKVCVVCKDVENFKKIYDIFKCYNICVDDDILLNCNDIVIKKKFNEVEKYNINNFIKRSIYNYGINYYFFDEKKDEE